MIRLALALLCLVMLALSGCVSKSDYDKLKAETDTARAEKRMIQAELEATRSDYAAQVQALRAELDALNSRFISVQGALDETQGKLDDAVSEAGLYKYQVAALDRELELYKETWGSRVAEGQPEFNVSYLHNNQAAVDPTYDELKAFIKADPTDENIYVTNVYMCGEFAADVHDNAEGEGMRAGWAAILLDYGGEISYHACNVFKTTDKGLIFIDCTGMKAGESSPPSCDKVVNVKLNSAYKPRSLYGNSGWRWLSMGIVKDVEIYW